METIAAAWLIRQFCPDLKVRVVNVVDLTVLFPRKVHPHGLSPQDFVELFTADGDVTFAFHGYARAMHQILHGRSSPGRFHVHGFWEQGTTTTPFDMVVLNEVSRYHLARSRRASHPGLRARDPRIARALRGDARTPSQLHPRAPRRHARGP